MTTFDTDGSPSFLTQSQYFLLLEKLFRRISTLALAAVLCGCGSIVNSTKETELPKTTDPLTAVRYYLPKGRVQVSAAWNLLIPGWEPTIKTVIEADPTACYRVDRKVNVFFDDDITIQVDPLTGLLQSVSATSTDQSLATFGSLAAGAESALTFGANFGSAAAGGGARGAPTPEELAAEKAEEADFEYVTNHAFSSTFSLIVDPRHPKQDYYLVEPDSDIKSGSTNAGGGKSSEPAAHKLYAKYEIELARTDDEPDQINGPATNNPVLSGIVIRTAIPYTITVTAVFYQEGRRPISQKQEDTTQIVFLPDVDHDYFLPLPRIPLVTTSTSVTLMNGMVQTLQRKRPSLANAIAGIPKYILSALLPVPSVNQNNYQGGAGMTKGGGSSTSTEGNKK